MRANCVPPIAASAFILIPLRFLLAGAVSINVQSMVHTTLEAIVLAVVSKEANINGRG